MKGEGVIVARPPDHCGKRMVSARDEICGTGSMPAFVGLARRRERANLVAVRVEAVDFQMFGRSVLIEADLDRQVALGFELGDLLPFLVGEINGHSGMDGDRHPADFHAVAGQREEAHDVDGMLSAVLATPAPPQ